MILSKSNKEISCELRLIYEISKVICNDLDSMRAINGIYSLLEANLSINDISLWSWNEENSRFKLIFNKNNRINEKKVSEWTLNDLLNSNVSSENPAFTVVDSEIVVLEDLPENLLGLNAENLNLFLPLFNGDNISGLLAFSNLGVSAKLAEPETLFLLNIVSTQISTAIINEKFRKLMTMTASISNATKDIAKIIETQYELDYVIPLMGEILDKYLSNALVYIFMKTDNGNFKLSWPSSYSEKTIDPLLQQLAPGSDAVFSENRYAIALPLLYNFKLVGAIVGDAKIEEIDEEEAQFLKELSVQCCTTLDRASNYAETVKYATIDALTGLDNRRQLDKRLLQEASVVLRTNRPLSALMIDIDHFKRINDTHGHSVGDHVLKEVAKIIKETSREYDIAGRYGGEEFVVLMPDTPLEGAEIFAERLREKVENTVFKIGKYVSSKSETIKLTLSIGIAFYDSTYKNPADVYEEADIALYRAKQDGRNRVVTFNY